MIILHHCRCADCAHLLKNARPNVRTSNECRASVPVPEELDPDAWHYCACYHGPSRGGEPIVIDPTAGGEAAV